MVTQTLRNIPTNERLRLFAASASEYAIVLTDADGLIVEWSPGAQHMLGWTPDEALNRPLAIIFNLEDRAAGAPEVELDVARRNGHASDRRWHMKKDGSLFFVDAITQAIHNDSGAVIGFGKVLLDLTKHKLAQDADHEHANLLDLAYDAVFTWAFDSGVIRYWNTGAAELYGYMREEALGRNVHTLLVTVFPEGLTAVQDALWRTGHWEGELTHTTWNGRRIKVQSRMVFAPIPKNPLRSSKPIATSPNKSRPSRHCARARSASAHLFWPPATSSGALTRRGGSSRIRHHGEVLPGSPTNSFAISAGSTQSIQKTGHERWWPGTTP